MPPRAYERLRQSTAKWFASRMPPCLAITEMISESMERRLTLRERVRKKLHLLICVWCARYEKQLFFMRETFHERNATVSQNGTVPGGCLSSEARERIRRAMSGEDG